MRIQILTQTDAFYIPRLLDYLLATRRDVVGITIVPGEMRTKNVGRYLRAMGVFQFAHQVGLLLGYRTRELVAPLWPGPHSWSVRDAARRAGVPLETVPRVNAPDYLARLERRGVDLVVSVACPQRLGPALLRLPRHGCINIHGALLPRYQGMLPSFWVLARGERETGVTVHWMDERLDHGDILMQRSLAIGPDDTVHSLVLRSKIGVGSRLLVEAIAAVERGDAPRVPMDHSQARYFSFPDETALAEFRRRGRRWV